MPSKRIFAPKKTPPVTVHGWTDGTALAIVSSPRGEDEKSFPVWFSRDGSTFSEGTLDFAATKVEYLNEFSGSGVVPTGRIFKYRNSFVFEASLGANVRFKPAFEMPDSKTFTATSLVAHPNGTLWLGGYQVSDSAIGWVYVSDDAGKTWVRIEKKLPGSVRELNVYEDGVLALAWRSVVKVTKSGVEELAKFKDVVTAAHIDARGIFGFGETFTAFVAPGKKAKYGKFLGDADRTKWNRVVFAAGTFFLLRGTMHVSTDALAWAEVTPSWDKSRAVQSVLPSAEGALVVTYGAEVHLMTP